MCQTAGALLDPSTTKMCEHHYHLALAKLDRVLKEDFGGNFTEFMSTLVDFGADRKLVTPVGWNNCVLRRVAQRLPGLVAKSPGSRFNSTQALKRFCRQKYKESTTALPKPPKNSGTPPRFYF